MHTRHYRLTLRSSTLLYLLLVTFLLARYSPPEAESKTAALEAVKLLLSPLTEQCLSNVNCPWDRSLVSCNRLVAVEVNISQ